jgi:hypothetical protein
MRFIGGAGFDDKFAVIRFMNSSATVTQLQLDKAVCRQARLAIKMLAVSH